MASGWLIWIMAAGGVTLAEMGDKTQLLTMAFATRHGVKPVLGGLLLGITLNQTLAVIIGHSITRVMFLQGWIQAIAALSFIGFGLWTLRDEPSEETTRPKSRYGAMLSVAIAFSLAELGDKTQLATIALAARFPERPFSILSATILGMMTANAIGIWFGSTVGKKAPQHVIKYVSAGMFILFGLISSFQVAREVLALSFPVTTGLLIALILVSAGGACLMLRGGRNAGGNPNRGHQNVMAINLGFTRVFLVPCQDGYLLVDTGYAPTYNRFVKKLHRLGVLPGQIKYLLLTHHHDDHAGFAAALKKETGCRLIVHEAAVTGLSYGESQDTMRPVNRRVGLVFSLFRLIHRTFEFPPVPLDHNDIIIGDAGMDMFRLGINGTVIHTPGHCRDSISLVLQEGNAFVGDAAMNILKPCGTRHRPIYIEDLNTVYQSWNRLLKQGARTIYTAHGTPFRAARLKQHTENVPPLFS